MLLPALDFSLTYPRGGASVAELADHYTRALESCRATVTRVAEDELHFTVSLRSPERIGLNHPDLGILSGGTLQLEPREDGYRVHLQVRPRSWVLLLTIVPWAAALWAVGLVAAPWRYLLALGGLPLAGLMWLIVWSNVRTFLDVTHGALAPPAAAGAGRTADDVATR